MKKRRFIIVLAILGWCYVSGPFIAGSFQIGYRGGPVIYPETFHEALYIIAHESSYNEKPRLGLDGWMYDRPIFYGLPRRLKAEQERQAYIEKVRQGNDDPGRLARLIEMNQAVQGHKK